MQSKHVSILLLGLILVLGISGTAVARIQNGIDDGKKDNAVSPAGAFCFVTDVAFGNIVANVAESTPNQENLWWAEYEPNGFIFNLKFVIKYSGTSFVRHKTVHKYTALTNGDVSTPFSPSFWAAGDLRGPAILKVKSEEGTCAYFFNVTP